MMMMMLMMKEYKRKGEKRNSISRRKSFLCENKTQTREMIVKVLSEREFFLCFMLCNTLYVKMTRHKTV